MSFDLNAYLRKTRDRINQALPVYIQRYCPSERMRQPVEYVLMGPGKRVRPILCLASCEAVSDHSDNAMPAACALEMIHTYSLVHDDLPALDNDALRRGRPTCHVKFNESTAILTGDALLNMAFELLAESASTLNNGMLRAWVDAVACIARASGCRGMIDGQARDLANEGVAITIDELKEMHALKTGALIAAAIESGAILGNASPHQRTCLDAYAKAIGLAFQVVDDILNVTGDPQVMGKAVGTDAVRAKSTYPALLGLPESEKLSHTLIDRALQALLNFDSKADPLRAIAKYIIERKR